MPKKTLPYKRLAALPERTNEQCKILWDAGERKLPGLMHTAKSINSLNSKQHKDRLTVAYETGTLCLELHEKLNEIVDGDLSSIEKSLLMQAEVLNAAFLKWLEESFTQVEPSLAEQYMNMALRCQKQCQRTLGALAEMKNPRRTTTFIKNQQNVLSMEPAEHRNQLEPSHYAENLDTIAASTPIRVNPSAAPLDA